MDQPVSIHQLRGNGPYRANAEMPAGEGDTSGRDLRKVNASDGIVRGRSAVRQRAGPVRSKGADDNRPATVPLPAGVGTRDLGPKTT